MTDVQTAYLIGRGDQFEMGGISTHGYAEIETTLDMRRFNRSLQKLIKRQPMLRAIIYPNGLQQILKDVPEYEMVYTDISHLSADEQMDCILKERKRMSHHVFKTDEWPLFEFKAFKLTDDTNYLFYGF